MSKACIWLREYLFTALLISGHKLIGSRKDLVMILCTQLKPTCERMLVPWQCLQTHLAASWSNLKLPALTWSSWQASCVKEVLLCGSEGLGPLLKSASSILIFSCNGRLICSSNMHDINRSFFKVLFMQLSCACFSLSCSCRRIIWAYWVKEARERKHDLVLTKFAWELMLGSFVKGPTWFFSVDKTIQTKLPQTCVCRCCRQNICWHLLCKFCWGICSELCALRAVCAHVCMSLLETEFGKELYAKSAKELSVGSASCYYLLQSP